MKINWKSKCYSSNACYEPVSMGAVHAPEVINELLCANDNDGLIDSLYVFFEITASLCALLVFLPFMILIAIIIRLDSPGPALFIQYRTGKSKIISGLEAQNCNQLIPPPGGFEKDKFYLKPVFFPFIKFRTMYSDAQLKYPERYAYDYRVDDFHTQYFKVENDPRVTRVGKTLRRLTIDELPNLWCVVVGEMRLVGPRPEIPEVLKYYQPKEMYKFSVKPGITGLAQINGRGNLSWRETIDWDLCYVRSRNIKLDLKTIFATIWNIILKRGAF